MSTTNPYMNALIGESWLDVGGDNVVTVYFASDFGNPWSAAQLAAFNTAFASFEAVCNIDFQVTHDRSQADIVENLVDTSEMLGVVGNYHGWQDPPSLDGSSGYFDHTRDYWSSYLGAGSNAYYLILHELGHGLGLEHPHSTWHGSGLFPGVSLDVPRDLGDHNLNRVSTTVMSYNYNRTGSYDYGQTSGPSAFDIAALQMMYGSRAFATGDDTYLLPDQNGAGTFWTCIWDTGGVDTIAYDGSRDAVIDLREATLLNDAGGGGYFSGAEGIRGGVSIANGVDIENARGGRGNDTLVGNALANIIDGGDGIDRVSYHWDTADLYIDLNFKGPQSSGGSAGGDTLVSIENLTAGSGSDVIIGNGADNVIEGRNGDDALIGDWGRDALHGGEGYDRLWGGDGRDTLVGGAGRDRLWGGDDRDVFDFNALSHSRPLGAGRDVIMDFERGRDDIDLSTIDANTSKSGNQSFVFIGTEKFHRSPGEVRYVTYDPPGNQSDKILVSADVNGDGKSDFQITVLGLHQLAKGDFIL